MKHLFLTLTFALFSLCIIIPLNEYRVPIDAVSTALAAGPPPIQSVEGRAGDLEWKVLFNMPDCDHSASGQVAGVWCSYDDKTQAGRSNGVIAELESIVTNPDHTNLYFSYFSFSNYSMIRSVCTETVKRDLQVQLFISSDNVSRVEEKILKFEDGMNSSYTPGCLDRIDLQSRSQGFGSYIQHSKITMATSQPIPSKASDLQGWIETAGPVSFTSSSANMSSTGPTINFENWIFFRARANDYVAQQNVCVMMSFAQYDENIQGSERKQFKDSYKECLSTIKAKPRDDLTFYMVPSKSSKKDGPYSAFKRMAEGAEKSIKVAIHRFTTTQLGNPLIDAQERGVPVQVLYDDDTLALGVQNDGPRLEMGGDDVYVYQSLYKAGLNIRFLETNPESYQMAHNKFMVVDGKELFQGAGNFTSKAFNSSSDGTTSNSIQFVFLNLSKLLTKPTTTSIPLELCEKTMPGMVKIRVLKIK